MYMGLVSLVQSAVASAVTTSRIIAHAEVKVRFTLSRVTSSQSCHRALALLETCFCSATVSRRTAVHLPAWNLFRIEVTLTIL